jgi:hypothetical protein
MLCPCWFGVAELMVMDQGWCASALLFVISQGTSASIDLTGCKVVLAFDLPGPTLFDGNGVARLYIDESATAGQRRELEAIFQGTRGGPMEILAGLMSRWPDHKDPSAGRWEYSDGHGGRLRPDPVPAHGGRSGPGDHPAERGPGLSDEDGKRRRPNGAQRLAMDRPGIAAPVRDPIGRKRRLSLER